MPLPKLGTATTIGTNNPYERARSDFREVPKMRAATFGDKLKDFQLSLMDNPAIQALGLMPTPGVNLAIGPFSPAQRAERLKSLVNNLAAEHMNGGISTEMLNRAATDIKRYPRVASYLHGFYKEPKQNWNGRLSSVKPREEIKSFMESGPKTREDLATAQLQPTDAKLFVMRVKPRKSDETTTRHEFGHLARWITNPDSSSKAGNYSAGSPYAPADAYKLKYGYWLNPEEIRARAIAAKSAPRPLKNHGDLSVHTYTSSYPKNDYQQRLAASIQQGVNQSSPSQRNRFFADIDKYFPWYDPQGFYTGNIKPGVPVIK